MTALELKQLCENINEADSDLEKVHTKVAQIKQQMQVIQGKAKSEKDAGKTDSIIQSFINQIKKLKDEIVALYKAYDSKHGTRYQNSYA